MKKNIGILLALLLGTPVGLSANIWELRDKTNSVSCIVDDSGQLDSCPLDGADINRGTIPNARLDSSSVTLQGNSFNGANQLVQLNGSSALPAVDGSALTGINAATATSLAANGANCSAGFFPLGVDALGAAESCTDAATQAELDSHTGDTSAHSATSANTPSRIVLRDGSGDFSAGSITASLSGNATTASALAANPTDCSAGQFANAIAANGNLTCSADGSGLTGVSADSVPASGVSAGTFSGAFTFSSALTVVGVNFRGGVSDVSLQGSSCGTHATAPCLALNTVDFDLYTSTGTGTGQWRNTRTGVGP